MAKVQQKARWGNQDSANFQPLHTQPWPFMTREYLDNHSPSRCKKITKEVERQRAFSCNDLIYESGKALKLRSVAIAAAQSFYFRFFALRDMRKNDRFVVSMACMFLASKSEDSPLAVNDVIHQYWKARFYRKDLRTYQQIHSPAFFEPLREAVLMAERAILFAFGFSLRMEHPSTTVARVFNSTSIAEDADISSWQAEHRWLLQASWTAAMDSSRTQACLQWDTRAIGVACILIVFQKNKIDLWSAPKRNGECFFMSSVDKQTRRETVQVIADYIVEALYDLLASKGASGVSSGLHSSPSPASVSTTQAISANGTPAASLPSQVAPAAHHAQANGNGLQQSAARQRPGHSPQAHAHHAGSLVDDHGRTLEQQHQQPAALGQPASVRQHTAGASPAAAQSSLGKRPRSPSSPVFDDDDEDFGFDVPAHSEEGVSLPNGSHALTTSESALASRPQHGDGTSSAAPQPVS